LWEKYDANKEINKRVILIFCHNDSYFQSASIAASQKRQHFHLIGLVSTPVKLSEKTHWVDFLHV
jgi:hypothetical protein